MDKELTNIESTSQLGNKIILFLKRGWSRCAYQSSILKEGIFVCSGIRMEMFQEGVCGTVLQNITPLMVSKE